jgi:hypothetical protein
MFGDGVYDRTQNRFISQSVGCQLRSVCGKPKATHTLLYAAMDNEGG